MTVFLYKAIDPRRAAIAGTVVADSPRQARDLLRARGLTVQALDQHESRRAIEWGLWRIGGGYSAKLADAIRELATLLGVGIPLVEALDTLCGQSRGRFQTALLQLRDRVAAGAGLADAMAEQPAVFDPLCIHMVEVGENAGNLDRVLDQLADFKERSLEFKDRVLSAVLYPAIVLAASCRRDFVS